MKKLYSEKNLKPWYIRADNFPANGQDIDKLGFFAQYGLLAPSVHNKQPWELELADKKLVVKLNSSRLLRHGDPANRQAWISVGALCENIDRAAIAFGYVIKLSLSYSTKQIVIEIINRSNKNLPLLKPITNRRSDRTIYNDKALPKKFIVKLKKLSFPGTRFELVTDKKIITEIAQLNYQALCLALSMPELKNELATLVQRACKKPIGIPAYSLTDSVIKATIEPWRTKFLPIAKQEAGKDYARIISAPALCLVLTPGDITVDWFNAGRLYQKTFLQATGLGLSASTFAATIEAPDFHQEIERRFKTQYRLQAILRVGYGQKNMFKKPTPRLSIKEIT